MNDYIPNFTHIALILLEGDINYLSNRYFIDGYEKEDLSQELRMKLWKALPKYDPDIAPLRTWANIVMRNRLRDLLRRQRNPEGFVRLHGDIEVLEDLGAIMDILDRAGLCMDDFLP